MKTLKLEVGKTYRSREGKEVKIIGMNRDSGYQFKGSDGEWYAESGRFAYTTETSHDLIEEVEAPPATPEEAQPLFDALQKAGKRWNAETMQVEEVPEVERIREWVWENLKSDLYAKGNVAEAIEAYLKYREDEK